jgi:hypothetical protein
MATVDERTALHWISSVQSVVRQVALGAPAREATDVRVAFHAFGAPASGARKAEARRTRRLTSVSCSVPFGPLAGCAQTAGT